MKKTSDSKNHLMTESNCPSNQSYQTDDQDSIVWLFIPRVEDSLDEAAVFFYINSLYSSQFLSIDSKEPMQT